MLAYFFFGVALKTLLIDIYSTRGRHLPFYSSFLKLSRVLKKTIVRMIFKLLNQTFYTAPKEWRTKMVRLNNSTPDDALAAADHIGYNQRQQNADK